METVDTAVTLILANDIFTLEGALIDLGMVHNFNGYEVKYWIWKETYIQCSNHT